MFLLWHSLVLKLYSWGGENYIFAFSVRELTFLPRILCHWTPQFCEFTWPNAHKTQKKRTDYWLSFTQLLGNRHLAGKPNHSAWLISHWVCGTAEIWHDWRERGSQLFVENKMSVIWICLLTVSKRNAMTMFVFAGKKGVSNKSFWTQTQVYELVKGSASGAAWW